MTEQEAIKIIKNFLVWNLDDQWLCQTKMEEFSEMAIAVLEEIQRYRALGTVEELREAREKQVPKKPIFAKSMMTKNMFQLCPICERTVIYDGIKFGHCQYCGQAIDWSDTE